MAQSSPDLPRTLASAREEILKLRSLLSAKPKPIPAGTEPVKKAFPGPDTSPVKNRPPGNMAELSPKAFALQLEASTTAELLKMIRDETDGRVMVAIRKELKERGV